MKNNKTVLYYLLILILTFSCKEDDVMIVTESDFLRLKEIVSFKFNEQTGAITTEDFTQRNFDIQGRAVNRITGVSDKGLLFDGLSNEVAGVIPANALRKDEIIISMWLAPKTYPVGTAAMLALTEKGSNTGVMVGIDELGKVVAQVYINGQFIEVKTEQSIPRSKWSHLAVGFSAVGGSITFFLDNKELKSTDVASGTISLPSGDIPVSIGKNTMGESRGIFEVDFYSGALDEIRIYSGFASPEAVDFIYSQFSQPGSVDYNYSFDYSEDTNRPTFHAIPDFGWANESHGLIYLNGTYHMFYQKNEVFLGIGNQNWGHFTSPDLVNWDEQPAILWPSESWDKKGIWVGNTIILNDGTPAAIYTGVDGVKAGVGTATSSDNFTTLNKNINNPVIASRPPDVDRDFRDPFVWEDNGVYKMIVGSGIRSEGGNVVYYESTDFENWEYKGIALQGQKNEGEGEFWEVPVFVEFDNGKQMLLVQKTPDATRAVTFYWIGEFVDGKFVPDFQQAKLLEVVNGFLSPTVNRDQNGLITAIGIIPDAVSQEFNKQKGWANLFSVPQVWTLSADNTVHISPHPNLISLRDNEIALGSINLTPSVSDNLNGFKGRHFEMNASIDVGSASQIGFEFGKTPSGNEVLKVYYDVNAKEWVINGVDASLQYTYRDPILKGNYAITGSKMDVKIFIDGSVLEVFIDNKAHFTGRFYPTSADATGVDMYTVGGNATADVTIYEIDN